MKYLKVDYSNNFTSICDSKEEVMENCGYGYDEMTFEEFLIKVKGDYDIIEITGDIKFLKS